METMVVCLISALVSVEVGSETERKQQHEYVNSNA